MDFSALGGEFGLIELLAQTAGGRHPDLLVGIGDDAAVLRIAPEPHPLLLVTTDLLVEDRHFTRKWSSARQVGRKAAECNLSDIAAMGGTPSWMFVSLMVGARSDPNWCQALYQGLSEACTPHGVVIAGGDTIRGLVDTISITLLGNVIPQNLRLRSHARPGDLLAVTGEIGGSAAALALLKAERRPTAYLLQKHLTPRSRLDISPRIAPLAHAMIDISDGLAAEVRHICKNSRVGAEIDAAAIPLHHDVVEAGCTLGIDPLEFALVGGEDFELLFSISAQDLIDLNSAGVPAHVVGRVTAADNETLLHLPDGRRRTLNGGYDHFL